MKVFLDFETATFDQSSACSLGLVQVKSGEIVSMKEWLIQPPNNEYDPRNIAIHGIDAKQTEYSPTFDKIWPEILSYCQESIIFAHNASFDMSVLRHTLNFYGIDFPTLTYACTMKMAQLAFPDRDNYRLDSFCREFKITFKHHNALDDSIAAFNLYKKIIEATNVNDLKEFIDKYGMLLGKIYRLNEKYNTYEPCSVSGCFSKRSRCKVRDYMKKLEINKDADKDHMFYNKCVLFTGELRVSRKKAASLVAEKGGIPVDNFTKKVKILVVGFLKDQKKSSKQIKAEEAILNGADIDILTENDFFSIIEEK